jgi:RNA polymerase sigma factor (sigma-70 family)
LPESAAARGFFSLTDFLAQQTGALAVCISDHDYGRTSRTHGTGSPRAGGGGMTGARARRGDLQAYDELVKRYQERIYATIYHMTSNHEDANDLAQESFIKAFQALKSFKGGSSFYTWLYRIAVNKTINFLKQRKNRTHMSLNDIDFNAEHDPDLMALISDKTPRRDAGLTELQEKLNAALLKLSEPHRLVVVLHDVQGQSHEEIARSWIATSARCGRGCFMRGSRCRAILADYLKPT